MAHMQLEVEKQKKKKSPVADIVSNKVIYTLYQHGSRVVRAFTPCLGGPGFDSWPSQSKDFKLVVEASLTYKGYFNAKAG